MSAKITFVLVAVLVPGALAAAQIQPLEDVANVDFSVDVRVFAVMAALNAAGFDFESEGQEMSEWRLRIRRRLEQVDPVLLDRLKSFYRRVRTSSEELDEQAAYISLALILSGPPEFKIQVEEASIPLEAWKTRGFETLVAELWRVADLQAFWAECRPAHVNELLRYRPVLKDVIRRSLAYFRVPPRVALDRRMILIPDLLNARNVVNARNLERTYYIAVGPGDDPRDNFRQLQHEHLHFLIDPLVAKYGGVLLRNQDLLDLAQQQPELEEQYQNRYLLIVTESLIESILLRMHAPQDEEAALARLFRQGFILAPYFHRSLEEFEKQEMLTLPLYLETVFGGIRDKIVEGDAREVQAWWERERAERAALEEQQREIERRNRINALIREAGQLLAAEDWSGARAKLGEVTALEPENPSALFYLGQVSAQQQQWESALHYYLRVADSEQAEDWVRAWSLVRVGRLLASQQKFEEARRRFEQVLSMPGDLKNARERARESLQHLP